MPYMRGFHWFLLDLSWWRSIMRRFLASPNSWTNSRAGNVTTYSCWDQQSPLLVKGFPVNNDNVIIQSIPPTVRKIHFFENPVHLIYHGVPYLQIPKWLEKMIGHICNNAGNGRQSTWPRKIYSCPDFYTASIIPARYIETCESHWVST